MIPKIWLLEKFPKRSICSTLLEDHVCPQADIIFSLMPLLWFYTFSLQYGLTIPFYWLIASRFLLDDPKLPKNQDCRDAFRPAPLYASDFRCRFGQHKYPSEYLTASLGSFTAPSAESSTLRFDRIPNIVHSEFIGRQLRLGHHCRTLYSYSIASRQRFSSKIGRLQAL